MKYHDLWNEIWFFDSKINTERKILGGKHEYDTGITEQKSKT